MLNIKNIELSRGSKTLFEGASATVFAGHKVGLVGLNGTGKTSLLKLLLGEITAMSGEIELNDQYRMAHVSQETEPHACSALEFVLQGDKQLYQLQHQIAQAEAAGHFEQLAQHHADFAEMDGYAAPARAASLLSHLGFTEDDQAQPVATFSGGWRVRLNLARALFTPSDLLLLDEPTNHLDLKTIFWLQKWLRDYQGTLIVISHDRAFLDEVISHVLHIQHRQLHAYTGNYSQFEAVYSERLALQQKQYEKQQAKIKHMTRFIERFGAKATKAKQAQSRVKMINKMQTVAAVQMESPIQFEFYEPDEQVNPLITTTKLDCGYDEAIILRDVDCQILRGDRIGLLGNNGAGKSTLIKTLMGEIKPVAGIFDINKKVKIGYFAQHQLEFLDGNLSPIEHLREVAKCKPESECRSYLGSFGFQGERIFEPLSHFSGGEKSRLALSLIIVQRPSLLLLDEPTNHLDLETRMALMLALQNYSGSLLLVSHDRYLMQSITDTLLIIENGRLNRFDGSLDDYQQLIQSQDKPMKTKQVSQQAENFEARKKSTARLLQIERKLTQHQQEIQDIDKKMCDPDMFDAKNRQAYVKLQEKKLELSAKIQALEEEWLENQS